MKTIKRFIASLLKSTADKIESDNCALTEQQAIDIFRLLGDEIMSKEQSISFLDISRSKFDSLVDEKKIPKGRKIRGFKEFSWKKSDLLKYVWEQNKGLTN